MRILTRTLLTSNLTQPWAPGPAIPAQRWYGAGAVPADIPERPFAEIKFGGDTPGIGDVVRRRLEVWIHDEDGDYEVIDKWLKYIKRVMMAAEQQKDATGEIIAVVFQSYSPDLNDDGYRTACKMASFELIGKDL